MVTDRYIFVGIPHTGGGSMHQLFSRLSERALSLGLQAPVMIDRTPHQSYSWMTDKCKLADCPIPPAFAFVRNPWHWNVSMWTWTYQRCGNRRGFAETDRTFEDYLEFRRRFEESGEFDLAFSGVSGAWRNLGGDSVQYIGRTESIRDDGARILSTIVPDLVDFDWARAQILQIGKYNQVNQPGTDHPHGPYQEFYTDETRGWIAEWEKDIIERFGYTFQGEE